MEEKAKAGQLRAFGLTVGAVFALIAVWPALFRGQDLRWWAALLAGLLIIPALLFPTSLGLVYRGWMAVGQVLGWVNTRLILGVIFYVLFTPMGLVMRLLGKDPMHRHFEPDADTYRMRRQLRPESHMKHQF